MERHPQTLANHAKFDPLFHFILAPVLIIGLGFSISFAIHRANGPRIWLAVLSLMVLLLAAKSRIYALKVQDRVIRLEERVRARGAAARAAAHKNSRVGRIATDRAALRP